MTKDQFDAAYRAFCRRRPFRTFLLEFTSGHRISVGRYSLESECQRAYKIDAWNNLSIPVAAPPFEFLPGTLPNLVGLDPIPSVAEDLRIKSLRIALKQSLKDTSDLVNRVNGLPANLPDAIDAPMDRQLLDKIVAKDADLIAVL